jgi:hypothetical protein
LAAYVRRSTRNGRELVRYLVAVMRDADAKPRDRLEATKLLLERGWGRTPPVIDPLIADEAAEAQRDRERIPLEAVRALFAKSPTETASRVYDV